VPEPQQQGTKRNVLRAKLGPLETWVWLLIVSIAFLIYYVWQQHKASTSTAAPASVGQPGVVVQNIGGPDTDEGTAPPKEPKPNKDGDGTKGKGKGDEPEDKESKEQEQDERHRRHRKPPSPVPAPQPAPRPMPGPFPAPGAGLAPGG
jgi:hypothetical protein